MPFNGPWTFLLFRGTKDFTIEMSHTKSDFDQVVSGTLDLDTTQTCKQELREFMLTVPMLGRYIKFIVNSHYAYGASLSYLTWLYKIGMYDIVTKTSPMSLLFSVYICMYF